MKPAKKPKAHKVPAWSHPATNKAAIAIRELLKLKAKQAIMAKKSALLQQIIITEGGGAAHGVRAAIRHQRATVAYRRVNIKAKDFVHIIEDKT